MMGGNLRIKKFPEKNVGIWNYDKLLETRNETKLHY